MIMTPEQREQRKKQRGVTPTEERTGRQSLALAHTVSIPEPDLWVFGCLALALAPEADTVITISGAGRFERIIEAGCPDESRFCFVSSTHLLEYAGYGREVRQVLPWLPIAGMGGLVSSLSQRIDQESIPLMRAIGRRLLQDIDDHLQDLLVERVVEVVNGRVVVECAHPICQSAAQVLLEQHEADLVEPIKDYENQNI